MLDGHHRRGVMLAVLAAATFTIGGPVRGGDPQDSHYWMIFGNLDTRPEHFIGTADGSPLIFKTDFLERMRIHPWGDVEVANDLDVGNDLNVAMNLNVGLSLDVMNLNVPGVTTLGASGFNARVAGMPGQAMQQISAGVNTLVVNGNAAVTDVLAVDDRVSIGTGGAMEDETLLYVRGSGLFRGDHLAYFENTQGTAADGIAIQLSNPSANSGNNFLTFYNGSGVAVGGVQGQTTTELLLSFDYIWANSMAALDLAFVVAEGVACGVQIDVAEVIVMAAEGAAAVAQWAELNANALLNVGVTYESGGADYAEWLEKADPAEVFSFGDIVGVRAGRISKVTAGAEHFMVISERPIVVGNMPPDHRAASYEKVAFMGQVRVKVVGPVRVGDYILPSARHDGFGVAVRPRDMILSDYDKIVGVSWEASAATAGFSYVRTAVGINANDLVTRMTRQQEEIDSLKRSMNTVLAYLESRDPGFSAKGFEVNAAVRREEQMHTHATTPVSTRTSRMAQVLRENPETLAAIQADAREILAARGIDFRRFEQTERLMTDPAYLVAVLEGQRN